MTTESINQDNATPTQPAQQTSTDTASSGQSQSARTFTQAELDHHAGERAKRAAEAAVKKILGKLGLASEAELEAQAATIEEARKRKESELTESQKAQAERDQIKKERDEAIAERDRERAERRNDKIASALSAAASKLQAKDTEDVVSHAQSKHAEEFNALIDDAGKVDKDKIDALLEKIKVAKPHYFGASQGQMTIIPSNNGGRINTTQKFDIPKIRI